MGLGISLQAENRLQEAKEAFSRAKMSNTLTPELQAFVDQKLAQLSH
jgi:MSHA biogenesis protein MshN